MEKLRPDILNTGQMEDQFVLAVRNGEQPVRSTAKSQADEDVGSPGARSALPWVLASSPAARWRTARAAVRPASSGATPPPVRTARLWGFMQGKRLTGEGTIIAVG